MSRKSEKVMLRVRSSEGMSRHEVGGPSSKFRAFLSLVPDSDSCRFYRDQRRKEAFSPGDANKSLSSLNLKHGDIIYSFPKEGASLSSNRRSRSEQGTRQEEKSLKDDDVDLALSSEDGKIPRSKGENCHHASENAKCIHCTPLEPFDASYQAAHQIKHLSFHAYLRQMRVSGPSGGKYKVLEDISCSIKKGCKDHPVWPEGICSKCQPPAITLNRQTYRHVDNIMFENPKIVEEFLTFWRKTGKQRMGFLYGRYEVYKDVPLGIKTVVSAIYEPPQESTRDSIVMVPDDKEAIVEDIAAKLGLKRVGWIFSDLIPSGGGDVKYIRHADTHLLSAAEVITAAHFQNKHQNTTKASPSGTFGSKFVTVFVSGNAQKQIHLEGFQVSNQCMALVRDNCLIPTKDAPELGWVRESSNTKYVPDVFFKEKNEYGNEIMKPSRPLPVIYMLVDVPVSHPLEPLFTFPVHSDKNPFPVENRPIEGNLQDFATLAAHRKQYKDEEIPDFFRDFHVLLFLATLSIVPLYEHMDSLLLAVKNKDLDLIKAWSDSTHWQTVEQLILYS